MHTMLHNGQRKINKMYIQKPPLPMIIRNIKKMYDKMQYHNLIGKKEKRKKENLKMVLGKGYVQFAHVKNISIYQDQQMELGRL